MRLCYMDESRTPQIPGNTSHYVLAGFSIPINKWKQYNSQIESIKRTYGLTGAEIHTAWLLRPYLEQNHIPGFESLDPTARRFEMQRHRTIELQKLAKSKSKSYSQTKKNFRKTEQYMHLTFDERKSFIYEIAEQISSWKDARLFAECINKLNFDTSVARLSVAEQAFEQVVSRFEKYLQIFSNSKANPGQHYGLLIHDNNETEAKNLTDLMKAFHAKGTFWLELKNIIETPLFVNSELTSMVQLADLCAFSLRRYLENQEEDLFLKIFKRGDRDKHNRCVGIRHYTGSGPCDCLICGNH